MGNNQSSSRPDYGSLYGSSTSGGSGGKGSPPKKRQRYSVVKLQRELQLPKQKIFDIADYTLDKALGEGSYGCTIQVSSVSDRSKVYALKIIQITNDDQWDETHREISMGILLSEVNLPGLTGALPFFSSVYAAQVYGSNLPDAIKRLVRDTCVNLYSRWSEENFEGPFVFILMENIPGGDLQGMQNYDEDTIRSLMFGMLWGLHGASQGFGFVHNDLSLGNVLTATLDTTSYFQILDSQTNVPLHAFKLPAGTTIPKIIDLGFSFIYTNKKKRANVFVGTQYVQPPEGAASYYMHGKEPDRTAAGDVWAIAVLALILVTRKLIDGPYQQIQAPNQWELNFYDQMEKYVRKVDDSQLKFHPTYHKDLVFLLLYYYEFVYAITGGIRPNVKAPARDTNEKQLSTDIFMWTQFATSYIEDSQLKNSTGAYYAKLVRRRERGLSDPTEFIDLITKMMSWDYRERESTETGLLDLLTHPFFKQYRIDTLDVGIPLYQVDTSPSLYNQPATKMNARLRDLSTSGYYLDKHCLVGCANKPKFYCQCCAQIYCSEECANQESHK